MTDLSELETDALLEVLGAKAYWVHIRHPQMDGGEYYVQWGYVTPKKKWDGSASIEDSVIGATLREALMLAAMEVGT